MVTKSLEEYLKLPYTIEIIQDFNEENPGWVARVVELPGCITQSDTFEGLQAMLDDAMQLWISTAIEDGLPIPEPREMESYSGKFIVRVPKSLHRQLVEQAELEGISLNQYVSTVLAMAVGTARGSSVTLPQITREEVKEWIFESFQNILGENKAAKEVKQAEKTTQIDTSEKVAQLLFKMKTPVQERIDSDYQEWLKKAGHEPTKKTIGSSILDNLLE